MGFGQSYSNKTVAEIGSALLVDNVLEGSVRKQGDRLRVTAQLINVADGFHLWSKTFDRNLKDIFKLQDEIILEILKSIQNLCFAPCALPHALRAMLYALCALQDQPASIISTLSTIFGLSALSPELLAPKPLSFPSSPLPNFCFSLPYAPCPMPHAPCAIIVANQSEIQNLKSKIVYFRSLYCLYYLFMLYHQHVPPILPNAW